VMAPTTTRFVALSRTILLGSLVLIGSCDGETGPAIGTLRFGQLGEIRIQLIQPLQLGVGELQQILTWGSSGPWRLAERISYRGILGDEQVRVSDGDPDLLAAAYAQIITQLNETTGLNLFIAELDPLLDPPCGLTGTRMNLRIRDEGRKEEITWSRCTTGDFKNISPVGAGPDPQASRVVQAALLVKAATLGDDFISEYEGSVPFSTLDRGETSNAPLSGPLSFASEDGWPEFWAQHTAPGQVPPAIDFDVDQVVVAAVGLRTEAGDSVEVRRILRVGVGSLTHIRERIPGDFCSPAARDQVPFHIVLAPKTPLPMAFAEILVERVSCGR
jgi:hypothetical protein